MPLFLGVRSVPHMLRKSRYAALFLDKRLTANTAVAVFLLVTRHMFVCKMLLKLVDLAPSFLAVLEAFTLSFTAGALYFAIAIFSKTTSLGGTFTNRGQRQSCERWRR